MTATAPETRSTEDVIAHLRGRRAWIARQRRPFERYLPLPLEKRCVSGETHLFLGRQYRLRIQPAEETSVKLAGPFFHVRSPEPRRPQAIAAALEVWYRLHAERILRDRWAKCILTASSLRLPPNLKLSVRAMRKRWGSCSKSGAITLNVDLVKTPLHCIDYVILHELCHLKSHDHGAAFFRLLGRCMPDWKARKERLEAVVLR